MNNWFGKIILIPDRRNVPDAIKALVSEECFILSISDAVPFYIVEQIPDEIAEKMPYHPSDISCIVYSYCYEEIFNA